MTWLGIMAIWLHEYKTYAGKMQIKILKMLRNGLAQVFSFRLLGRWQYIRLPCAAMLVHLWCSWSYQWVPPAGEGPGPA
jgi:hypothetical protein